MGTQIHKRLWQKYQASKFHQKMQANRGRGYFLTAVVIITLAGAGLVVWLNQNPVNFSLKQVLIPQQEEEPKVYYASLNGEKVSSAAIANRPITAVMIENSLPARPQSGLKKADLVFEAIAEGGITRFMALYQQGQPNLVGPVRSLRPYFLKWSYGFDASVAHVGGSPKALDMIRSGKYSVDIDQFIYGDAYWRSSDRYAPHNMYTSFNKLNGLNKKVNHTSSKFKPFSFKDNEPAKKPVAKTIDIGFSAPSYSVKYRYQAKSNNYLRFMGGQKHVDDKSGQIKAKVVIVMQVNEQTVMEDTHREAIDVTSGGTAYIFQDGKVIKARWVKSNAKDNLEFVNKKGEEIKLNRGPIWISALPKDRSISWQ